MNFKGLKEIEYGRSIPIEHDYLLIDKDGHMEPTTCDKEWLISFLEGGDCLDLDSSEAFQEAFLIFQLDNLERVKVQFTPRSISLEV